MVDQREIPGQTGRPRIGPRRGLPSKRFGRSRIPGQGQGFGKLGTLAGKAGWTFVDQGLSSLTNSALFLLVAHSVQEAALGAFALALAAFTFIIGVGRATIADPLVIRFTANGSAELRAATGRACGAAVALGLTGGGICAAGGLVIRGDIGTALFALALSMPGLILQDTWRYAFFAAGTPIRAAANDLAWAIVQFSLIGVLIATDRATVFTLTLAWGGAALVAALLGMAQAGAMPRISQARGWFTEQWELSARLGADYVINMAAVNLATFLITSISGVAAAGQIRSAQALLGPLNLAFAGVSSFVLPVYGHRVAARRPLLRPVMLTSAALTVIALSWTALLFLVPESFWLAIFKQNWAGAQQALLPTALGSTMIALVVGAALGLKALSRANLLLKITLIQAPLILGLGTLGAAMGGARGAAYGFFLAQAAGCTLTWLTFLRNRHSPGSPGTAGATEATEATEATGASHTHKAPAAQLTGRAPGHAGSPGGVRSRPPGR